MMTRDMDMQVAAGRPGAVPGVRLMDKELMMMVTKRFGLVFALLGIMALVLVAPVAASVTVSDSTELITAVNSPPADGIIILRSGTYFASGMTVSKDITIRADTENGHGPWDTIIDGSKSGKSILTVTGSYTLAIDNLTLQNGVSIQDSGRGGAISADSGSVSVTSSTFIKCSASNGGAIYAIYGSVSVTSSTFSECSVSGTGSDSGLGGAIYAIAGSVSVTSSTFNWCSTKSRGGAITTRNGDVKVMSSTFTGCSASGTGSGSGLGGAIYTNAGSVSVTSSTFTGCWARDYGGAISADSGSVSVTSSTFTGCSASGTSGSGGAIYTPAKSVSVTSSTFTGCSAINGGAIYADSVTVTSSTFTECSASGSTVSQGGAIFTKGGTINFCRFYHDSLGTAVYNGGGSLDATDNWWGTSSGPSSSDIGGSGVTATPWLKLGIAASPSTITNGATATITANLTYLTDGKTVSAVTGTTSAPDGTLVHFTATGGSVSPEYVGMKIGIATTTFTPSGTGTATITATLDGQSVTIPITVTAAGSGTIATSIVIDSATTPATIYAGVDGKGIYKSTNSGTSWTGATTQPANTKIKALVIHPLDHTKLFAATYGSGVFRSPDSGDKWSACSNTGLDNPNVLSLVSDSTGKLYAGTVGGVFVSTDDCTSWTAQNTGLP